MTGCGVRSTSLWAQRNLFWQLSRDGNLHGIWYVTHSDSLSKTSLQSTLEGGQRHGWQRKCWMDNVKEWTSLPMPKLLKKAPEERTERGSLLNCLSRLPNDPIGHGTELNWTETDIYERLARMELITYFLKAILSNSYLFKHNKDSILKCFPCPLDQGRRAAKKKKKKFLHLPLCVYYTYNQEDQNAQKFKTWMLFI